MTMLDMDVSTLDIFFLAVLLISLLMGLWRGLVYEVLSLGAWVAAAVVAQMWGDRVAADLPLGNATVVVRQVAGYVLMFVGTLFAGGLLAWLLKKLVESVGLRPMDRVLGGGFGLLRGAVILMVMGVVAVMTGLNRSDAWTSAIGARWIDGAVAVCAPILLPDGVLSLMQETPGNPHPAKP